MKKYDIGTNLKKLRLERGLTQKELASITGISRGTLSRIENKEKDITILELVKHLNYYNIPLNSFFTKIIYIDTDRENITKNFNTIVSHYQNEKNNNLYLIKKEIHFFRQLFEDLEKNKLTNLGFNIQYYMELPLMYPKYFKSPNIKLLNYHTLSILNSNYWFEDDYVFLACAIPHLTSSIIDYFTKKFKNIDFDNLNNVTRNYYEIIFENLTDFYLVNYKKFDLETLESTIQNVFNHWNIYAPKFSSMQNKIILKHNYTMYEFLFNKRDKEILKKECIERSQNLSNLVFPLLANQIQNEADDYYNGLYGHLNISIKY